MNLSKLPSMIKRKPQYRDQTKIPSMNLSKLPVLATSELKWEEIGIFFSSQQKRKNYQESKQGFGSPISPSSRKEK